MCFIMSTLGDQGRKRSEGKRERENTTAHQMQGLAHLLSDRVEDENQDLGLMELLCAYWLKRMMPCGYSHCKK